MSKDKSKTKSTSDEFAKPSEAAGGDSWSLTDGDKPKSGQNDGKLFLITPLRKEMVKTNEYGDKEVIVADVVELDEKKPEKSVEHENVYVWGAWLQGSLRSYIGTDLVLGRVKKVKDSKSGKGYVWKLEDADDDEIEVAREYRRSIDPFTKKKAEKGADADDKPKGKKSKAEPEPEPKKGKGKKAESEKPAKGKKKK